MKIILSQRMDTESEYDDVPFSTYHYPKRYRNQIHSGDRFIYYQGNRHRKDHRYYFGCGVVGAIEPDASGENFYAEILAGHRFAKTVPIYSPGGDGFIESLGYNKVRKKPKPSWQSSIRKISDEAFFEILKLANINPDIGESTSHLESGINALDILRDLNTRYADIQSEKRATKEIQSHLDRGSSVTKALKSLLGAKCQICGWEGFEKKSGEDFIEAHHIVQLSERKKGSLCTENIILICPNCHREVHYGKDFSVSDDNEYINVCLSKNTTRIRKNTIDYLSRSDDCEQD